VTQDDRRKAKAHLREIASIGSPMERQALAHEVQQEVLHEAEDAKGHPFRGFRLDDVQWAELRAYLRDGGGVTDTASASKDGRHLDQILHDAVMAGDQETFMNEWPHWLKAHWKATGRVRGLEGGGVGSGPHGTTGAPSVFQERPV
jgi:hypothetical protein